MNDDEILAAMHLSAGEMTGLLKDAHGFYDSLDPGQRVVFREILRTTKLIPGVLEAGTTVEELEDFLRRFGPGIAISEFWCKFHHHHVDEEESS
jgi:hypothetical protein